MKSSLVFLFVLLGITLSACASKPAAPAVAAVTSEALPEIAPYDDEPFELLPDTVPVVEEAS